VKIPRLIGKKNSMLNLIRDGTGCNLFVGRNGRIWVKGENIARAQEVILKIEKEAHTPGLTERIVNMLKENGKGLVQKSALQEVAEEVTPDAAEKQTAAEVTEQIAEQDEVPEKTEGEING
jgi:exosome complex component RRP4